MFAKTALRRAYHLAKGTFRPGIEPLGAYPLDSESFVFRFETKALKRQAEDGMRLRVSEGDADVTARCIELRKLEFARGGSTLVRTAYSISLDRRFEGLALELLDASGTSLASHALSAEAARGLLDDFARLSGDAASDKRYEEHAGSFALDRDFPWPADSEIEVAVVATRDDPAGLLDTLESICMQGPSGWHVSVVAVDDARLQSEKVVSSLDDPRISLTGSREGMLSGALDEAIAQAHETTGVLFLEQGDVLVPGALARFCHALASGADLAYCDTDFQGEKGRPPSRPQFKPDFNLDLLYSQNYIGTAFAVGRKALAGMGERPVTVDSAWSYEIILKTAEAQPRVEHFARIGCHLTERNQDRLDPDQEVRALEEHFERRGIQARIERSGVEGLYRTTFLPEKSPLVSIVIPSKDHIDYLEPCIASIHEKAGYGNYEVVVVENHSIDPETFAFYDRVTQQDDRVRVVDFAQSGLDDGTFNYPQLVNYGVRCSHGSLLLLLNNDTQAITPGFLSLLVGYFDRPEVGVVGTLLLHADGLVQHAGMALLESGRAGFMNQHLSPDVHAGYLNSLAGAADCSCVLGACQMVSHATFDAVGGYREELAITGNDIDFCWKVRERGQLVVFTPHARLYHKEFGSRRSDDADEGQLEQSRREVALLVREWPKYYEGGDGFINPNLDRESIYYRLALPNGSD